MLHHLLYFLGLIVVVFLSLNEFCQPQQGPLLGDDCAMRTKFLTTEATDTSTIINLHAMLINGHRFWRTMGHTMSTLFAFTGDTGLCGNSIFEQIFDGGWQTEVDVGILRRAEVVCC